ncbi:MAG: arginine--tRNA ligase [Butyrivibrio sp.]|nr:arginine--tRNA ligase [Butyrivibrio sp.]
MEKLLNRIGRVVEDAFEAAGYERSLGRVSVSNRPDLCEFQCNGAMAGAKQLKMNPMDIAESVAQKLAGNPFFERVEAVKPGFLNLTLARDTVRSYLVETLQAHHYGVEGPSSPQTVVVDYGGANVAKPLHVGHLRPAVIGEAIKRIIKYNGYKAIGDVHLGDWGMPMGLVIAELERRQPELPYFDPSFTGVYPKDAPFTVGDLEEMYPTASARSKEDEAFKERAQTITQELQAGRRGYRALWHHIMDVSVVDMKKNYDRLNTHFELWRGESDVNDRIPAMLDYMIQHGYAHESEGALVIDIAQEEDKKEYPPCIIRKTNGAAIYATTDLATIEQRMEEFHPVQMVYVIDKRQQLQIEIQTFRAARKSKLVLPETKLNFVGNGTLNGADGKPYKTREGTAPRLGILIDEVEEKTLARIREGNPDMEENEARETARKVALAAIRYGDLANQPSKDYIFDIEKFTAFEGDTGPYLLYTIVRIKSILKKAQESGIDVKAAKLDNAASDQEKALQLVLTGFAAAAEDAYRELAPNRICAYLYEVANTFNGFYHETKILTEADPVRKESYIALLYIALGIMETGIDLLGIEAPEKM